MISSIRFDRAITLGIFHPLSQRRREHSQWRIPILMYHGIRSETWARYSYFETNTAPARFAEHLRLLRDNGYITLTLGAAVNALAKGSIDGRQVVLTFDDGYRDFYSEAFPVLRKYGFVATVFVITGATGAHRKQFKQHDCLTWDEIRELHAYGISIGSHTVTHCELRSLGPSELDYEITKSKDDIEKAISTPVQSFSYPYAFPEQDRGFRDRLRDLLKQRGYRYGVSTILGTSRPGADPFCLPRLPVNSWDDADLFRAKLEGAYDWLRFPQRMYKTVKR